MEPIKTQDCYTTIAMKGSGLDVRIQIMVKDGRLDKHENVIIITKEDFEKAIGDAFSEGVDRGITFARENNEPYPKKSEYINSII